jgi:ribose 5-phosphate isomerase B
MRIALGADHAGVDLKNHLKSRLESLGFACHDFGPTSAESVDYPDFAAEVGRGVAAGAFDRGILVCGSGLGMAIAANKVAGIRAVAVVDQMSARLGREHNDANVLALGARLTSVAQADDLVDVFLNTPFSGGRHQQRIDKLAALDKTPR